MTKLIVAAAAGFLLAAGLLWLVWTLAPYPLIDGQEYESVLQEALIQQLNAAPTNQSAVYIKPNLKRLITSLQARFPQRRILPWSERPTDLSCEEHIGHVIAPCARNDYLSVDTVIFPLWRTAIVTVSTAASGSQLLLIEIGSKWRVVSRKGFVI